MLECSWLNERTDLNDVVGTIMINQQLCSCMIEHVVREWRNNKTEQRCYNNHGLVFCIKSAFACSNIREQPPSIRQAVYNMLKHDWTILLSVYQSCSLMLTVLLMGCWANIPATSVIFYASILLAANHLFKKPNISKILILKNATCYWYFHSNAKQ